MFLKVYQNFEIQNLFHRPIYTHDTDEEWLAVSLKIRHYSHIVDTKT